MGSWGRFPVLTALVVLATVLSGCSRHEPAQAPARGADRIRVLVLPYTGFAPLFIAEAEGYFAEQGLEVEHVHLNTSGPGLALLLEQVAQPDAVTTRRAGDNQVNQIGTQQFLLDQAAVILSDLVENEFQPLQHGFGKRAQGPPDGRVGLAAAGNKGGCWLSGRFGYSQRGIDWLFGQMKISHRFCRRRRWQPGG